MREARPTFLAGLWIVALLLLPVAGAQHAPVPPALPLGSSSWGSLPPGPTPPSGGQSAPNFPSPIRHVIVILLENEEATSVLGTAPYETHLAYQYAYANRYYATTHPSAPNYLSITAGSYFNQSGSDAYNVWKSLNIADLVQAQGETWGAFDESMPAPCDVNNSYPYAVKHNPLTYYADIVGAHASRCNPNVVDFNAWNADVAAGTIPNYCFITPNMLDDGHDTNVSYADKWLSGWLSPLINNSAIFSSSAFFTVYDEGSTNAGYNGTAGGNVYMSVVSPYSHMGYWSQKQYSHWNMLTTAEWLLGLTGHTYHNDNWTQWPPMKDLFTFPAPPHIPPHYLLQGTVWGPGGTPITGATVATGLGNTSTTAANGTYRFALVNGTYTLTASASGYASGSRTLTVNGASQTLDFNLSVSAPTTYTLTGVVQTTYPTTVGLVGASVFANASGGAGSFTATSSSGGSFQVALPNGTYSLTATEPTYVTTAVPVTVNGAAASTTLTLNPKPLAVRLGTSVVSVNAGGTARVLLSATTPGGVPATGAVFSLTSSPLALPFSPAATITVPSNGTGFVSFVAPTVTANTPVSISASVVSGSSYPGHGMTNLTLVPAGGALPATVSGSVLNASSAQGLVGATVQVLVAPAGALVLSVVAGSGGGYLASGLTAGTYTLVASDPGYRFAQTNITLAAGANAGPVDLNLTPLPHSSGGGGALAVSASGSPTQGTAPLAVAFTSSATGGSPPYSYAWSFGDGASSTQQDPSHTYAAGSFSATVTVSDSAGHTASSVVLLSVSVAPGGGSGGQGSGSGGLGALTSNPYLLLAIASLVIVAAVVAVVALRRRRRSAQAPAPSGVEPLQAWGPGPESAYAPAAGSPSGPGHVYDYVPAGPPASPPSQGPALGFGEPPQGNSRAPSTGGGSSRSGYELKRSGRSPPSP